MLVNAKKGMSLDGGTGPGWGQGRVTPRGVRNRVTTRRVVRGTQINCFVFFCLFWCFFNAFLFFERGFFIFFCFNKFCLGFFFLIVFLNKMDNETRRHRNKNWGCGGKGERIGVGREKNK